LVTELLPDATPAPTISSPSAPLNKPTAANRLVGLIVLGVMLVCAGVGLVYALVTVDTRRAHDHALPRKIRRPWLSERQPEPALVEPGDLVGLRYLPAKTKIIGELKIEDLLLSPLGKELPTKPIKLGPLTLSPTTVREWTGLEIAEVHHLAFGVVIRDTNKEDLTPPPIYLLVATEKPYNADRLRAALQATRPKQVASRTLYQGRIRGIPVNLWFADDKHFMLGLFGDFTDVPTKPSDERPTFDEELLKIAKQRVGPLPPLWIVGRCSDWTKTPLPLFLGGIKDVPLLSELEKARGFVFSLRPDQPAKLSASLECDNEATAKAVLQKQLEPQAAKSPETFKVARDGVWLDVQLTLPSQ
jgi:hypothetical protein